MPPEPRLSACATSPAERAGRAILAVALLGFAAAAVALSVWLSVALALAAVAPAFGSVTGRCPVDYLRHRRQQARNTLGIGEARQPIDVGPKE